MGRLNSVYMGLPQPCSTVSDWRVCWVCVHCYRRQLWAHHAEGPVTVELVSSLKSIDDSTSSVASALRFLSTPTQLLSSNRESVLSPALPPVGWKTLGKMLRTHVLIWKMRNGGGRSDSTLIQLYYTYEKTLRTRKHRAVSITTVLLTNLGIWDEVKPPPQLDLLACWAQLVVPEVGDALLVRVFLPSWLCFKEDWRQLGKTHGPHQEEISLG